MTLSAFPPFVGEGGARGLPRVTEEGPWLVTDELQQLPLSPASRTLSHAGRGR
jgi:hypothetical protein